MEQAISEHIETLATNPAKQSAFQKLVFRADFPYIKIQNGVVYCVEQAGEGFDEKSNDVIVNKVKLFIKKSPKLFSFVYHLLVPVTGKQNICKVLKTAPSDSVIVNLGSGVTLHRADIVNVDFFPFRNVDVVADVTNLPFADNSVDLVISECVLEHVRNPRKAISEMERILKPSGRVYVVVPFVFSFHSSPHDYRRWTSMGLEEEFSTFTKIDGGIHFGPGNALDWILAEYLATLFSFGFRKLHQILFMIFLVLFAPLCYLDYLVNYVKTSENIASHIYYIGKKN